MKKEYKQIYDEIKPGEELLESVFEMRQKKKTAHFSKRIVSAVLALAILAGGTGFGVHYSNSKNTLNNPVGTIMIAEAKEAVGAALTDVNYRIVIKDITGLTEKELYDLKVETLDKELDCPINHKPSLDNGLKNILKINGNALYATATEIGVGFIFDNIENSDDVKKISVSNMNEYGNPIIVSDDIYYKEPEENVFIFSNQYEDVDYEQGSIAGHNISIEGSRYAQCRRIESKKSKIYTYEDYYESDKDNPSYMFDMKKNTTDDMGDKFSIIYRFTEEFFDALGKNPTMDLSAYEDEMTFKVDFKNGYTATTVIKIGLNKDGRMFVNCKSYNYSKTK